MRRKINSLMPAGNKRSYVLNKLAGLFKYVCFVTNMHYRAKLRHTAIDSVIDRVLTKLLATCSHSPYLKNNVDRRNKNSKVTLMQI